MEEKITNTINLDLFSDSDLLQLEQIGIEVETLQKQLSIYANGVSKMNLARAAKIGDGILNFGDNEIFNLAQEFDVHRHNLQLTKFVPASGAASRMFQFLLEFLNEFDSVNESVDHFIKSKNANELQTFVENLDKFPFYNDLLSAQGNISNSRNDYQIIRTLLDKNQFNFSNKPKGVLPFHFVNGKTATPIHAHLTETAHYASSNGNANLHFTVSEEHQSEFEAIIKNALSDTENRNSVTIKIDFSSQDSATDSLAVCENNLPIRDENLELLLRPAGHGALLKNLNDLDCDIVFIKNIDNCSQNDIELISLHKKALGGILVKLQKQVFGILNEIDNPDFSENTLQNAFTFAKTQLNIEFESNYNSANLNSQKAILKKALNRPIRVCGMVKNQGEPGGGPFWTRDKSGNISLQIVELAQIDLENVSQKIIVDNATHFNPVDLVCGIRNYRREKFDLMQFSDPNSGFIVTKNKNGKAVKSYELPGLWNGAMANWISIFVEVAQETFSPVKTVNDLLKPAHQPK